MTKELTPLEALERIKNIKTLSVPERRVVTFQEKYKEELNIIETALKNYQELLKRPCVLVGRTNGHTKALIDTISKNYKEIKITSLEDEKEIKAFEIIKKKNVSTIGLKYHSTCENYNNDLLKGEYPLTKEEYDLLKEVLL